VKLGLSKELMAKLAPYADELRSIFIVSSVELISMDDMEGGQLSEAIPGLKILVSASTAPKCERCWVHDNTIGQSEEHPTLCKRCVDALGQIGK